MRKSQILSYPELAQQILISIRGERTQSDLSHQLGYSFNQVGKWESGATQFYWQDFTKLCDVLNINWKKQFNYLKKRPRKHLI